MSRRKPTFECPHCGAEVPAGRTVCRECGSDARTGWLDDEEIDYRSIDIPDGYGPDSDPAPKPALRRVALAAVAIVTALLLLWLTLLRR
ncbi:MAG: hypothetical protein H6835_13580 [Planctomycetes bacterium]|nr:hypothetical protein [Planctomycetota bacterium]